MKGRSVKMTGIAEDKIADKMICDQGRRSWLQLGQTSKITPSRTHDHKTVLKEGEEPVHMRPYRYPPAQKDIYMACHLARKIHTASTGFTKAKELNQAGISILLYLATKFGLLKAESIAELECVSVVVSQRMFAEPSHPRNQDTMLQIKAREHGQQRYIRGHEKDGDSAAISSSESNEMAPEPMTVNVSDPDFQNFDIGLNRNSFQMTRSELPLIRKNDGMPQDYARIHSLIPMKPFKTSKITPSRTHDHKTVLKEGEEPVDMRPYRYPPAQKDIYMACHLARKIHTASTGLDGLGGRDSTVEWLVLLAAGLRPPLFIPKDYARIHSLIPVKPFKMVTVVARIAKVDDPADIPSVFRRMITKASKAQVEERWQSSSPIQGDLRWEMPPKLGKVKNRPEILFSYTLGGHISSQVS
ncbi:hypothetical protein NC651_028194 [Populus alba x Populus x berolinensis]|nr:hypothetical protein NC651_028194 [Populus alba x Populus x berolinensis]